MIFWLSYLFDTMIVEIDIEVFASSEQDAAIELRGIGEGEADSCRAGILLSFFVFFKEQHYSNYKVIGYLNYHFSHRWRDLISSKKSLASKGL